MRLFCLLPALFWLSTAAAANFTAELKAVQEDPKSVVNRLSALPAAEHTAEQWLILSHGYMALLNKDGALSAVNQALEKGLSASLHIEALEQKALVYGIMFRDSKTALEVLKQAESALVPYKAKNKPELQTRIYESFAQGYNQRGDLATALKYAELSIAIATEHSLRAAELQSRLIAGRLMLQQNNFSLAQQHLSRALILAQQQHDKASMGSIHLRLAMAYQKLEQPALAADHLQQAEQLLQMPERRNQLISVLLMQIDVALATHDLTQAESARTKATTLLASLRDPMLTAQLAFAEAQLALAQKNPQQAEQQLLKAAQLFQQLGSKQHQLETAITLAEVALQQQQPAKAIAYLPKDLAPEKLPAYLQYKYWDLLSRTSAGRQDWQAAYQAAVAATQARFELLTAQEKQRLDHLRQSLQQQQHLQQLNQVNDRQQLWLWLAVTALAVSWLSLLGYVFWRSRRRLPATVSQTGMKSWANFCRQIRKDQQRVTALHLIAVQIQHISEFKLSTGEQLLRRTLQQLLSGLQGPALLDSTIHTDVLWLSVDLAEPQWQQQLQLVLERIQRQLPGQPALRLWQGPIAGLLGTDWQDNDLNGLRELVWYSWQQQQAQAGQLLQFTVSVRQPIPCSWQAENLRLDITNALALGLLKLDSQPLAPSANSPSVTAAAVKKHAVL